MSKQVRYNRHIKNKSVSIVVRYLTPEEVEGFMETYSLYHCLSKSGAFSRAVWHTANRLANKGVELFRRHTDINLYEVAGVDVLVERYLPACYEKHQMLASATYVVASVVKDYVVLAAKRALEAGMLADLHTLLENAPDRRKEVVDAGWTELYDAQFKKRPKLGGKYVRNNQV